MSIADYNAYYTYKDSEGHSTQVHHQGSNGFLSTSGYRSDKTVSNLSGSADAYEVICEGGNVHGNVGYENIRIYPFN